MPADTIQQPFDPAPRDGVSPATSDKLEAAPRPVANQAAPKTRTKRPRPTFEDGALTRVFKFPSKTYPKSSYYVTGDEIIIRIRKARKKWKLVIPKKRIRDYRTNRWFAKPRWIELELTYTQAVRLGLVEPRPVAAATDGNAVAAEATAPDGQVATVPADDAMLEGSRTSAVVAPEFAEGESVPACEADPSAVAAFVLEPTDTDPASADVLPSAAEEAWVGNSAADEGDDEYPEDTDGIEAGEDADELEDGDGDEDEDTDEVDTASIDTAGTHVTGSDHEAAEVVSACAAPSVLEPARELALEATSEAASGPTSPGPISDASTARSVGLPDLAYSVCISAPVPQPIACSAPVADVAPVRAAIAANSVGRSRPQSRGVVLAMALLGIVVTGAGIVWMTADEPSGARMAADTPGDRDCRPDIPSAHCAEAVVTGSIQSEHRPLAATPAPPASGAGSSDEATIQVWPTLAARDAAALSATETVVASSATQEVAPSAPAAPSGTAILATATADPTAANNSPLKSPSKAPAAEAAASSSPAHVAEAASAACRELATAARAIEIHFSIASAQLEPAAVPSLDEFAARLRSCSSARVIIEGHTDADGDTDRNQALSVRRAQAVWQHLINAGSRPDRVWVIGFGHSRPLASNQTAEDRRRNRRAVLIVEAPR